MKNNKNGITLITLIITIIILLILAAVTINMMLGENGLINKAKLSIDKHKIASAMEETTLALAEVQMEMLTDKTVEATDMADYIKKKGGVAVGKGQIYEEGGEYFYENDDGVIVQLINNDGKLSGDKIVEKPENANTGRVMYHLNGGKGNIPNSARVGYGETVTVDTETTPTRDGYNFLGWAQTNDATDPITDFTMPERNVTLYAVWQKVITITYNANGGSGTMEPTRAVTTPAVADSTFTAPSGKSFTGWNTKADGTGTNYAKDDTVNDDITLYAQWTELNALGILRTKAYTASKSSDLTQQQKTDIATTYLGKVVNNYTVSYTVADGVLDGNGKNIGGTTSNKWVIYYIGTNPNNSNDTTPKIYLTPMYPISGETGAYGPLALESEGLDNNSIANQWLYFWKTAGYLKANQTNNQAVAYLLKPSNWSKYAAKTSDNLNVAEYAIGGAPIEMFVEVWNSIMSTKLYCNGTPNSNGYQISTSNNGTGWRVMGLARAHSEDRYGLLIRDDVSIWYASPSSYGNDRVVWGMASEASVTQGPYSYVLCYLRPIVCLNKDVVIESNNNGISFSIYK